MCWSKKPKKPLDWWATWKINYVANPYLGTFTWMSFYFDDLINYVFSLQILQYSSSCCMWQRPPWPHYSPDIFGNFWLFIHHFGVVQFSYLDLLQAQGQIHQGGRSRPLHAFINYWTTTHDFSSFRTLPRIHKRCRHLQSTPRTPDYAYAPANPTLSWHPQWSFSSGPFALGLWSKRRRPRASPRPRSYIGPRAWFPWSPSSSSRQAVDVQHWDFGA